MLDKDRYMLDAHQYHDLYCLAFARLEDVARQAERAMQELEDIQLSMGGGRFQEEYGFGPFSPPHLVSPKKAKKSRSFPYFFLYTGEKL